MKHFTSILILCSLIYGPVKGQLQAHYFNNSPYSETYRNYSGAVHNNEIFLAQRSTSTVDEQGGTLHQFINGSWRLLERGTSFPGNTSVNDIVVHNGVFYFAGVDGLFARKSDGVWTQTTFAKGLIPLKMYIDDSVKVLRMNEGVMFQKENEPWQHIITPGKDEHLLSLYRIYQGSVIRPVFYNNKIYLPYLREILVYDLNTSELKRSSAQIRSCARNGSYIWVHDQAMGLNYLSENGSLRPVSDFLPCGVSGMLKPYNSGAMFVLKNKLFAVVKNHNDDPYLLSLSNDPEYKSLWIPLKGDVRFAQGSESELLLSDNENNSIYVFSSGKVIDLDRSYLELQKPLQGTKLLDANQILLPVSNLGDHGLDPLNVNIRAQMPERSSDNGCPKSTYNHAGIWIGGLDEGGQLHLAAMTYRQRGVDFTPGPLAVADGANLPNASDDFNKVWKIKREALQKHIDVYSRKGRVVQTETDPDIWTWPGNGPDGAMGVLAPFVDRNSNGIYEPHLGEYPDVPGDQCLFFIMNDQTQHTESNALPMGVEVHGMVYAWNCGTSNDVNQTVFFKYRIFNRSLNHYKNVVFTKFADIDLGDFRDDFAGCHVTRNTFYAYNAKDTDLIYGHQLPIQAFMFLNAPVYKHDRVDGDGDGTIDEADEKRYMGSFNTFGNNFGGNNAGSLGIYNRMLGKNPDGSPLLFGGISGDSTEKTTFAFPGNSDPDYSGRNWTQAMQNSSLNDLRMLGSTFPFDLDGGEEVSIELASMFIYDRQKASQLSDLISRTDAIKQWYYDKGRPDCALLLGFNEKYTVSSLNVYPNPAQKILNVDGVDTFNYGVYDLTGRMMNVPGMRTESGMQLNIEGLTSGIYVLQITQETGTHIFRFVTL